MCLLLETIKIKAGQLQNILFHNDRVNRTRRILFNANEDWDLSSMIRIPVLDENLIYRCRLIYSEIVKSVDFQVYTRRSISKLIITEADNLNYGFKFADRTILEYLKSSRNAYPTEDILIIKNGFVTDTSFSNIVFFDGSEWITPDTPLLSGTKRAQYLKVGKIRETTVSLSDIPKYQKARLINAMLDLEESTDIPTNDIILR